MKRFVFLAAILLAVCGMGFSLSRNAEIVSLSGVIEIYGIAPFSVPGIKADGERLYAISCNDKKMLSQIKKASGYRVLLQGRILPDEFNREMPGCPVFLVEKWKKL